MNNPNPAKQAEKDRATKIWATILATFSIVGLGAVLIIVIGGLVRLHPLALWGSLVLVIIVLLIALGLGANQTWFGVLIDSRNRVSLSRLQLALWTIIVISAYLAMALPRSLPGAMALPNADAIAKCKLEYIQTTLDVADVEALKTEDAARYDAAQAEAAEACVTQPLQIVFPEELLLALGISTTSFAGSSLIQSAKRNRRTTLELASDAKRRKDEADKKFTEVKGRISEAQQITKKAEAVKYIEELEAILIDPAKTADEKKQAEGALPLARQSKKIAEDKLTEYDAAENEYDLALSAWQLENTQKEGSLKVNATPQEANLGDMFQGDEIGNYHLIDFSKVQMFFLTVAVLVAYGIAIGTLLQDPSQVLAPLGVSYPPFSNSMNALMGISHAGYLTVKSVDQTKLQQS